jgi:AraC-like DNA-binding protein
VIVELPEVLLAALGRGPGRKPVATATNGVTWALGLELYVAAREGRTGLQERAARLMGRLQANSAAELRLARCESWLRDVAEALRGCARGQRRSLAELSAEAQRHPIYLARAFRRVYGVSPREYRQCSRVEQAVPAVAFGEIELVDLALALGFADQSHLGRVFRRTVGMTPGRLRRATRALLASV